VKMSIALSGLDGLKCLIKSERNGSAPEVDPSLFEQKQSAQEHENHSGTGRSSSSEPASASSKMAKVPSEVLERLEYHAAEVTIQKNMISKVIATLTREFPNHQGIHMLSGFFDEMTKHHHVTQSEVRKIRTTPFAEIVKPLFRLKRDLENALSKKTKLIISGSEVLLDQRARKIMSESLVHILRNSLDHGVEREEERIKKGKTPESSINLSISESGHYFELTIADDGRGIPPQRIREKVLEKGLMTSNELNALE
jgi:two-component system, chemotaxis family, sensor kinase CheA